MVDYIMRRERKVRGHKGMGLQRHNVSRSNRSGLKDIESYLYVCVFINFFCYQQQEGCQLYLNMQDLSALSLFVSDLSVLECV